MQKITLKFIWVILFAFIQLTNVAAASRAEVDKMIEDNLQYLYVGNRFERSEDLSTLMNDLTDFYGFRQTYDQKTYCERVNSKPLLDEFSAQYLKQLTEHVANISGMYAETEFNKDIVLLFSKIIFAKDMIYAFGAQNFCEKYYSSNIDIFDLAIPKNIREFRLELFGQLISEQDFKIVQIDEADGGIKLDHDFFVSPQILEILSPAITPNSGGSWERDFKLMFPNITSLYIDWMGVNLDSLLGDNIEEFSLSNSISNLLTNGDLLTNVKEMHFENVKLLNIQLNHNEKGLSEWTKGKQKLNLVGLDLYSLYLDNVEAEWVSLWNVKVRYLNVKRLNSDLYFTNGNEIEHLLISDLNSDYKIDIQDSKIYSLKSSEGEFRALDIEKSDIENISFSKTSLKDSLHIVNSVIGSMNISNGVIGELKIDNSTVRSVHLTDEIKFKKDLKFELTNVGSFSLGCDFVSQLNFIQSDFDKIRIEECDIDKFTLTDVFVKNNITLNAVDIKTPVVNRVNAQNFTLLSGSFGDENVGDQKELFFNGVSVTDRIQIEKNKFYNGFFKLETATANDFIFNDNILKNSLVMMTASSVSNFVDIGRNKCFKYWEETENSAEINNRKDNDTDAIETKSTVGCDKNSVIVVEYTNSDRLFYGNNVISKFRLSNADFRSVAFDTYEAIEQNNRVEDLEITNVTVRGNFNIRHFEILDSLKINGLTIGGNLTFGRHKDLGSDVEAKTTNALFKLSDNGKLYLTDLKAEKLTIPKSILNHANDRVRIYGALANFEILDDELNVITDAKEIRSLLIKEYDSNLYNSIANQFVEYGMNGELKGLKIQQNIHFAENENFGVKILYFLGQHINGFGFNNGRAIGIYIALWFIGAVLYVGWSTGWVSKKYHAYRVKRGHDKELEEIELLNSIGRPDIMKGKRGVYKILHGLWFSTDRSLPPLYLDSLFETHVKLPDYLAHWFYFQRVASFIIFLFFLASSFGLYQ